MEQIVDNHITGCDCAADDKANNVIISPFASRTVMDVVCLSHRHHKYSYKPLCLIGCQNVLTGMICGTPATITKRQEQHKSDNAYDTMAMRMKITMETVTAVTTKITTTTMTLTRTHTRKIAQGNYDDVTNSI